MKKSIAFLLVFSILLPLIALGEEEVHFSFANFERTKLEQKYPRVEEKIIHERFIMLSYLNKPITVWDKLKYMQGGMEIPYLFQNDFKNPVCIYDNEPRSVSTSGCAMTCLSMVIYYFTENKEQDPTSLFRYACENGYYKGNGLKHTDMVKIAQAFGVHAEQKSASSDTIREALLKGEPVIISMSDGLFSNGHYLVLRGINEKDEVLLNDPNNKERSNKLYPLKKIVEQSKGSLAIIIFSKQENPLNKEADHGLI